MKDKLKELAVKIIHDGESLPMLEISKGIYRLQKFNDGKWTSLDDDELLAILDAEGDGGAVATTDTCGCGAPCRKEVLMRGGDYGWGDDASRTVLRYVPPTHPARSGVVSDEDVEAAREAYFNAANVSDGVFTDSVAMRAALENFAKGETK